MVLISKNTIFSFFTLMLLSCKSPSPNSIEKKAQVVLHATTKFERILQDTTNNYQAKWDLQQLEHYNNICNSIGINKLYDGVDSFEIRVWRQFSFFGMAADEEIYALKIVDSTVHLTFYRVYCSQEDYDYENYRRWNPFTDPKIDSFFAVSKTFPAKIADSLNLQDIWNLKTQSALHIPDRIGFLDGRTSGIELASKRKYKLLRYHEPYSYYEKTGLKPIKDFADEYDKLINFFETNKMYDRND